MEILYRPAFWYAFLQVGVVLTFTVTAARAWRHSRARFVELISAFLFGLLLEQGDIFLFGTYRYNENWFLLGDVPIAIALTWALIIAGAMNMTDALGIRKAGSRAKSDGGGAKREESGEWSGDSGERQIAAGLGAPIADAVWAILLDLALDAVAIRLGLWTWTIRADEGWFGVPWGNFFAWLMVSFWFAFFTRLVRANWTLCLFGRQGIRISQWAVPFLAFGGLIVSLVPFVALENTAALPMVPDDGGVYHGEVWIVFALTLAVFVGVTCWALLHNRVPREPADHWLLLVRLMIHGLFLLALVGAGIYADVPLLLGVALMMLTLELVFAWHWRNGLGNALRSLLHLRKEIAPANRVSTGGELVRLTESSGGKE